MEHPIPANPLAVNGHKVVTAAERRKEQDRWRKWEIGKIAMTE